MSILNVTIDLLSGSIIEIQGPVDFNLLKEFEKDWLTDDFDGFREHFKPESEWCELMLEYVPEETLDGRVTAPVYYEFHVLSEGAWISNKNEVF